MLNESEILPLSYIKRKPLLNINFKSGNMVGKPDLNCDREKKKQKKVISCNKADVIKNMLPWLLLLMN